MMVPRGMQNPQHPGFTARDTAYDCGQCIAWHADRYHFPELDEANAFAWTLYLRVSDQQRVGMDVIGLDYSVLPPIFDLYGVAAADRPLLFEKIGLVNNACQEHRQRRREHDKQLKDRVRRVDVD